MGGTQLSFHVLDPPVTTTWNPWDCSPVGSELAKNTLRNPSRDDMDDEYLREVVPVYVRSRLGGGTFHIDHVQV